MSPERLAELEALAAAATPGPWRSLYEGNPQGMDIHAEPTVYQAEDRPDHLGRPWTAVEWAAFSSALEGTHPMPTSTWPVTTSTTVEEVCISWKAADDLFIAAARTAVPELITRVREAQTAAAELERQFDHERTLRRQAEEEVARLRALIAEQDDEDCLCLACGAARIGGTCVRAALAGNCPWGQAAAAHRARVEEVRDDG